MDGFPEQVTANDIGIQNRLIGYWQGQLRTTVRCNEQLISNKKAAWQSSDPDSWRHKPGCPGQEPRVPETAAHYLQR